MQDYPQTIIYRHRRENLKKCSLRGLEGRVDMKFLTYPQDPLPPMEGAIVLELGAPRLTRDDAFRPLCLFDATWRYADVMMGQSEEALKGAVRRSIPTGIRTAYPRRQPDCADPDQGLSSVEALFAAYYFLGRSTEGLLDHYYWKEKFLNINNFSCD